MSDIFFGSKSGKGKSYMNPADIFQASRRLGLKGNKKAGYGFYQGKGEFSMGFSNEGSAAKRTVRTHRALNIMNQQSAYSESGTRRSLTGKGWSDETRMIAVITVYGGRKLEDSSYSRDVEKYHTLISRISSEKSKYYLFSGGTIFEQGSNIIIRSAIFDADDLPRIRQQARAFASHLAAHGFKVNVRIAKR